MNIVQIHLTVVQPFAQGTARTRLVHLLPGFPHALQGTWGIVCRRRRFGNFATLDADDVRDQHRMVRSNRAAGFGDHRRVRQAVLFTGIANRPDDVVGIFVQAVVHRAVGLRAGPFVVHAQAAAHVKALDVHAKLVQLNIETRRFAHAGGDVANIRHLRAEVEMQQLNAVQTTAFAQNFHQLQHLVRREAELGFFTAGGLPLPGTLRCQTRTHAKARDNVQTLGLFQHDRDFGHLLDNQIDLVTHLLANQRQTNVFAIFIAVTDDHRAGHARMGQDRHQLRFRARFQTQRFAGVDQGFNHAAVLVHLDRINQEIVAVITIRFTRALERGVNGTQAMLQDLREAEQCRQTLALCFTGFHQLSEIHARFRDIRIRADADVAQLVDVVVVIAPPGNIVSAQHLAGFLGAHRNLLHRT